MRGPATEKARWPNLSFVCWMTRSLLLTGCSDRKVRSECSELNGWILLPRGLSGRTGVTIGLLADVEEPNWGLSASCTRAGIDASTNATKIASRLTENWKHKSPLQILANISNCTCRNLLSCDREAWNNWYNVYNRCPKYHKKASRLYNGKLNAKTSTRCVTELSQIFSG